MRKIFLFLIFNFFSNLVFSQDGVFSQPTNPGNILNPAFNGADSSMQIKMGSRLQWPKISGTYFTNFISYNSYITKANGYAGFRCIADNEGKGTLKSKSLYLFYAQLIKISKNLTIKPAIEFGFVRKTLDWSKLNFGDQIDSRNGFIYQTQAIPVTSKTALFDINIGSLFQYKQLTLGLNAHHITQPNESFFANSSSKLPMRFGVQLGYTLRLGTGMLEPFVFYQRQSIFNKLLIGTKGQFSKYINFMLAWRKGDAAIAGLGFVNKRFSIMYSYDYTISKLTNQTGGSHELTFGMRFIKLNAHKKFVKTFSVFAN